MLPPIPIEKLKVILMAQITLFDLLTPLKDFKCIVLKCLVSKNFIKDLLKQLELIRIENGSVMLEPLIKKHCKNLEYKSQKKTKIQPKYLSNQKKYQLLYFKIQQNKIKSDYYKLKLTKKHLALKVDEKK
jgi:hypothetical protein